MEAFTLAKLLQADPAWDAAQAEREQQLQNPTPPEPPAEPPAPAEEPEPELTPEDATPSEEPETPPAETPPAPEADPDAKFIERMDKKAKERFREIRAEAKAATEKIAALTKELELNQGKRLPDDWFAVEGAHVLDPVYQQSYQQAAQYREAYAEWGQELAKMKDGQDYVIPTPQGPRRISAAERLDSHEVIIQDWRNQLREAGAKQEHQMEAIAQNFVGVQKQSKEGLEDFMNRNFAWLKNDKAPEQAAFKNYMDSLKKIAPAYIGHPMAKLAIALGIWGLKGYALAEANKKQAAAKQAVREDARRAGPVPRRTGATAPEDRPLTMKDYLREAGL